MIGYIHLEVPEIAARLNTTEGNVRSHLHAIYTKFGLPADDGKINKRAVVATLVEILLEADRVREPVEHALKRRQMVARFTGNSDLETIIIQMLSDLGLVK